MQTMIPILMNVGQSNEALVALVCLGLLLYVFRGKPKPAPKPDLPAADASAETL